MGMMGGGGGIDEISIDTEFIDVAKDEALTFLAEALAEGLPYAERFLQKAFNQRIAFHDQAMADFDRIFALSEPYRMQGFAAFDKLNDIYGLPRLEGGSYEMAKGLEAEAKQRGLRQRMDRLNAQFVSELGIKDPNLLRNLNYLSSSGISPQGLLNSIEQIHGNNFEPGRNPYEGLKGVNSRQSEAGGLSSLFGGAQGAQELPMHDNWKTAGLNRTFRSNIDSTGLRNSNYDPFNSYTAQAGPLYSQLEAVQKQYTPDRRKLVQAIQTGSLANRPVRRI